MSVKDEEADVEIVEVDATEPSAATAEERCPACTEGVAPPEEKENWVRCDACKVWFHWRCVSVDGQELSQIDKWYAYTGGGEMVCNIESIYHRTRAGSASHVAPSRPNTALRSNRQRENLHVANLYATTRT